MEKLRSRVFALAVLAGFAVAAGPAAADGERDRDYPAAWRGLYAGVHLGLGEGDNFVGGGQIGYNWQRGLIVYGWEADATLSGIEDNFGPFEESIDWMATARGRLGYLIQPNILAYATAGLGLYSFSFEGPGVDIDDTETDFVFGLGVEGQFSPNTTLRVEYLGFDDDIDIIRAGLNFKLNGY